MRTWKCAGVEVWDLWPVHASPVSAGARAMCGSVGRKCGSQPWQRMPGICLLAPHLPPFPSNPRRLV
eukprot:319494-Chlamydomonas_euryale.AAC.1